LAAGWDKVAGLSFIVVSTWLVGNMVVPLNATAPTFIAGLRRPEAQHHLVCWGIRSHLLEFKINVALAAVKLREPFLVLQQLVLLVNPAAGEPRHPPAPWS
jgi:hypothetical protein